MHVEGLLYIIGYISLICILIHPCSQILYAKAVEERSMTFERSLEMGREHIMRVKGLILRSALIKNQIHVKSPPREGGGGGGQGSGDLTIATSNSSAAAPRN